ncbi:hypothetical protein A1O3_07737 [Capronia epimyces CBS 606.96]|uniref:BRCT domain-containing protein n=1 Tax=Capronia epimyces CBS 606.96 TaxID=1182542 RepID=W9XVS8_9EURO|nr:uncharacterized protein A1O3_07737 [Capronia epimyces CBS 606.96]EXJ81445.1 hypothetical protein A1O3_07737 [Capronia epimyces CBS 606.96]
MAPRKAASPAKPAKPRRVTRARAADPETPAAVEEPPRRKASAAGGRQVTARTKANQLTGKAASAVPATTRTKAIEAKSRVTKTESKPTRTTRAARSTPQVTNVTAALESLVGENGDDDDIAVAVAKPATKVSRTTRTTSSAPVKGATSTLAAAPRRRIRVTPLVEVNTESAAPTEPVFKPEKKPSTRAKREKTATSKSTATRSKRDAAAAELEDKAEERAAMKTTEPAPKQLGRGRGRKETAVKEDEAAVATSTVGAKTRGRPRKETSSANPPPETKPAVPSARQTRTRAGSANSSVAAEPTVHLVVPARKKVTFQDLPSDEDEKENNHPTQLSKSRTVRKAAPAGAAKKSATAGKGMRAKPIRNPAVTKSAKTTRGASSKPSLRSISEAEPEEPDKVLPRILTPKKITQVAKALPVDSEDDEEDELAGAKTPVHNLSLSPKRGIIPSMPHSNSPVKKLDFGTVLNATSPEKSNTSQAAGILSPPRRMPTSPTKDSLKESPRRAPEGITIFRTQTQPTNSSGSVASLPSNHQALLHQSPKRGLSDKLIFPPSAVKSQNSPLKTALLSSPARRLFSPSKQTSPKKKSPMKDMTLGSDGQSKSPGDVDLVMSSHFRSSVSPQRLARVYRLSDDELSQERAGDVDFDQSVLNVRSPLKADMIAKHLPIVHGHDEETHDQEQEEDSFAHTYETPVADDLGHGIEVGLDDDETMIDPTLSEESDSEQDTMAALQGVPSPAVAPNSGEEVEVSNIDRAERPRLSNTLFTRIRDSGNESEDELAADQTPDNKLLRPSFRPSLTGANIRSRLSAGIVPSSATRNLGFTPLTAQMRGWQAGSPPNRTASEDSKPTSQALFSPLARMHVEGSVEVVRHATPVRHGQKRKSLASRLSFVPSVIGSPVGPEFFAESMEAKDFENQVPSDDVVGEHDADLHELFQQDHSAPPTSPHAEDHEVDRSEEEQEPVEQEPGELTTDLINFTNASDTAMVDFKALAVEAELAAHGEANEQPRQNGIVNGEAESVPVLETVDEEQSMLSTSSECYGDENMTPIEGAAGKVIVEHDAEAEVKQPAAEMDAVFMDVVEQPGDTVVPTTEADASSSARGATFEEMDFNVTPVRPDPSLPRYVHTVSKVPLRPEGLIPSVLSPLKAQRKRPRSLSSSNSLSAISFTGKRRSLGAQSGDVASTPSHLGTPRPSAEVASSPQRRIRSAAPSPAHSLASHLSTPGQTSFAIDDFGDSTLDGIELPSDELTSDELETSYAAEQEGRGAQDDTLITIGSAMFKTPTVPSQRYSLPPSSVRSNQTGTPHYAMSTKSSNSRRNSMTNPTPSRMTPLAANGPPTISKAKTPTTLLKSKSAAKTPQANRTPLKPMGQGILHGATVHYDIHTTEGMDASGVFVELLTAMGARCVKEWRWNPRSRVANEGASAETPNVGVGITHVVYKDGGKRTLEKVRSAKGQVLCVGVGWVLDCYREGRWLDESAYTVDSSILPRGGSRRRKSMEPRMLVNENGLLSATKENRRFTWADHGGLTDAMKLDLINTPVRGMEEQEPAQSECEEVDDSQVEVDVEDKEDTETTFNSTFDYDSPTAATVGEGGETANVGLLVSAVHEGPEEDSTMISKTPRSLGFSKNRRMSTSTPQSTSLTVDYDPRTAATPLTPYLLAKGKGKEAVQMSAPPKQVNKGIFDHDGDGDDDDEDGAGSGRGRKFQVKMSKKNSNKGPAVNGRRKTLGANLNLGLGSRFKPVVGSPLRKE